jgi:aspartate racemase
MKTIGLIGGLSWASTLPYYRFLNETAGERLGGLHSAKIAMISVDFGPIASHMKSERWAAVESELTDAARRLARAGADFILIGSNTMHKFAAEVAESAGLPVLHIADVAAEAIGARGLRRVGLLGTRTTMEADFYVTRLTVNHGLSVLVPAAEDRETVDRIIFEELTFNRIEPKSKSAYLSVIDQLVTMGAECVLSGCTEIGLLIGQDDVSVPLFDTTRLHAEAAVRWAMGE